MLAVRPNPGFSLLDFLSEQPWIKRMIFKGKKKKKKDIKKITFSIGMEVINTRLLVCPVSSSSQEDF